MCSSGMQGHYWQCEVYTNSVEASRKIPCHKSHEIGRLQRWKERSIVDPAYVYGVFADGGLSLSQIKVLEQKKPTLTDAAEIKAVNKQINALQED